MKIELDEVKTNAIKAMVTAGGAGVEALRDLFTAAEAELRDVMNIDPKGNMGLQSLASQRAVETIRELFSHVFPDQRSSRSGNGSKEARIGMYR